MSLPIPTLGSFSIDSPQPVGSECTLQPPSSNSDGAFSFESSDTSVAVILGNVLDAVGVGSCVITATQESTAQFGEAQCTARFLVNKSAPFLGIFTVPAMVLPSDPQRAAAASAVLVPPTSTSSGAFTFESDNTAVARISQDGTSIIPVGLGTCVITARQMETDTHEGADTAATFSVFSELQWMSHSSAAQNIWKSVAFGNGLFVAVSSSGVGNRVMTSVDGMQWQAQTSAGDNSWQCVTFGDGLFVAVSNTGTGNRIMTSADGVQWVARRSPGNNDWTSVTFGAGLFVAVSSSGTKRVMTSRDGMQWSLQATRPGDDVCAWKSVAYGQGKFVAVGSSPDTDHQVMVSEDGVQWRSVRSAHCSAWKSVTFGAGLFVAVSSGGASKYHVMTSRDGEEWTSRKVVENGWQCVTFSAGCFVAVRNTGSSNRVMSSFDGVEWMMGNCTENLNWQSVTYGKGRFVAIAGSAVSTSVMSSAFLPPPRLGSFSVPPLKVGGPNYVLVPPATSSGAGAAAVFSYKTFSPEVAEIVNGNELAIRGPGACIVRATQQATTEFAEASIDCIAIVMDSGDALTGTQASTPQLVSPHDEFMVDMSIYESPEHSVSHNAMLSMGPLRVPPSMSVNNNTSMQVYLQSGVKWGNITSSFQIPAGSAAAWTAENTKNMYTSLSHNVVIVQSVLA